MVGDNIKKLREQLGYTQQKFAEQIGIKQGTLSGAESNKSNLSKQALMAISREFGVRLEWLETGEGEMYSERDTSILAQLEASGSLTPKGRELIEIYLKMPPATQDLIANAIAVAAKYFPRESKSENQQLQRNPDSDELTKAEVYEAIGIVPLPTKSDSELSPDEAADKVRQERVDVLAAQKREITMSSVSTGSSGTSKRYGKSP